MAAFSIAHRLRVSFRTHDRRCCIGRQSKVKVKFRSSLSGFGPVGIITILVILLAGNIVGAALVLVWARLSETPWRNLGFVRPRHGAADLLVGLVAGVVLKLVMKALVMPLLAFGSAHSSYHYLIGNTAALPLLLL